MSPGCTSSKEFLAGINSADSLAMVVRAHQDIKGLLGLFLSEALPSPYTIEVDKISFPLLVDLVIAVGGVPSDARPALLKLNRIRNDYAHDPRASFTLEDARDLFNTLSPSFRASLNCEFSRYQSPVEVFRECAAVMFVELQARITRGRDDKVRTTIYEQMAKDVLSMDPRAVKEREAIGQRHREQVERLVAAKRNERMESGG